MPDQPVAMLTLAAATIITGATRDHAATFCTIQFELFFNHLLAELDFSIKSQTANRFLINHTKTLAAKDAYMGPKRTFITVATKHFVQVQLFKVLMFTVLTPAVCHDELCQLPCASISFCSP